jgi:hypothetical protein
MGPLIPTGRSFCLLGLVPRCRPVGAGSSAMRWRRPMPTPGGVPVVITSPGFVTHSHSWQGHEAADVADELATPKIMVGVPFW